jgi:hypothetical protein
MLGDFINSVANAIRDVLHWFQTLTPGGLGLLLLPIIALDLVTLWVSRRPSHRGILAAPRAPHPSRALPRTLGALAASGWVPAPLAIGTVRCARGTTPIRDVVIFGLYVTVGSPCRGCRGHAAHLSEDLTLGLTTGAVEMRPTSSRERRASRCSSFADRDLGVSPPAALAALLAQVRAADLVVVVAGAILLLYSRRVLRDTTSPEPTRRTSTCPITSL